MPYFIYDESRRRWLGWWPTQQEALNAVPRPPHRGLQLCAGKSTADPDVFSTTYGAVKIDPTTPGRVIS